jgi:hypothetical protein
MGGLWVLQAKDAAAIATRKGFISGLQGSVFTKPIEQSFFLK